MEKTKAQTQQRGNEYSNTMSKKHVEEKQNDAHKNDNARLRSTEVPFPKKT